jgi:8-oxo-dGTP pyrophosphatase MutT (NUDIX family)
MRNPIRPGFGLPGGKVGVINGISFTVKCLIFSSNGLLIVKEKNPENKSKVERTSAALSFKEIRHRLWKMIARRKERGDFSINEKTVKEIIEKIRNQQNNSIILLSAVREVLEETGILIDPKIITTFVLKSDILFPHHVVICLGEIISGKLKKESLETFNNFLQLSNLPPTDGEKEAEKIQRTELMYYRHKILYLPSALKILLKKNYQFPFSKIEVDDFLKNITPA